MLEQLFRRPRRRPRRKRPKTATMIWIAAMIVLTAIVLYPLIWMGAAAFKPNSEFGGQTSLLPQNPTLDNFVKVLAGVGGVPLWRFFLNSTILAVGSDGGRRIKWRPRRRPSGAGCAAAFSYHISWFGDDGGGPRRAPRAPGDRLPRRLDR